MKLKIKKMIHKKTGNKYYLLSEDIINATNSNDGQLMCLYMNEDGDLFVRETKEFYIKFEKDNL